MKEINKKGKKNKPDTEQSNIEEPSETGQKAVSKDKKIDTGMTGTNARKDRNLEKSGNMEE